MQIQPLDDRLLVQRSEAEEQKVGNIIIPDTAKDAPQTAKVIAVGNDEDLQGIIKAGDTVIVAQYGGNEIKLNGEEYIILERSDVLGKLVD